MHNNLNMRNKQMLINTCKILPFIKISRTYACKMTPFLFSRIRAPIEKNVLVGSGTTTYYILLNYYYILKYLERTQRLWCW